MTVETEADLLGLRVIGKIVANCLQHVAKHLEPGITTKQLDDIAARYLDDHGARSAPKLTYKFPGSVCVSVNEEVAHGVPGERVLRAGDLVNIDVSAELDGYFADTGASFSVAAPKPKSVAVCNATRAALNEAMRVVKADELLNVIGKAVERTAKKARLKVIRDLCSHGVGRSLHEEPGLIPSYFDPKDTRRLWKGLVITIEPFLTTGPTHVVEADDGWTLLSTPGSVTAQYEHTMVITDGKPIVVTIPDAA
jgi:methionyl aminopeptidase